MRVPRSRPGLPARHQGLQDLHPLPLSHRQTAHQRLGQHLQTEALGRGQQALPGGRAAREGLPQRLAAQQHVVEHAQVVGQREVLVHHADAGVQRGAGIARWQVHTVHGDLARIGPVVAEQDRHQGALARTVFTQQRQHLATRQVEADVVVGQQAAEALADVAQAQRRRSRGHRRWRDGTHLAPGLGCLSSTFTVNLPARISASRALTLAASSAGTLVAKVPSGASSLPLYFIIEYLP